MSVRLCQMRLELSGIDHEEDDWPGLEIEDQQAANWEREKSARRPCQLVRLTKSSLAEPEERTSRSQDEQRIHREISHFGKLYYAAERAGVKGWELGRGGG